VVDDCNDYRHEAGYRLKHPQSFFELGITTLLLISASFSTVPQYHRWIIWVLFPPASEWRSRAYLFLAYF